MKDTYAGTDFGQNEKFDGNTVRGSYNVQLPDGRKQTVRYEQIYSNNVYDYEYISQSICEYAN